MLTKIPLTEEWKTTVTNILLCVKHFFSPFVYPLLKCKCPWKDNTSYQWFLSCCSFQYLISQQQQQNNNKGDNKKAKGQKKILEGWKRKEIRRQASAAHNSLDREGLPHSPFSPTPCAQSHDQKYQCRCKDPAGSKTDLPRWNCGS